MLAAALVFCGPALACEGLQVAGAWIREAPPGASVMAGYASLRNAGSSALTLDGVHSADFSAVELHRTQMQDGRMQMRAEPRLPLDPGAAAQLQPGGLHLMLFDPRRALQAGDRVAISFDCGGKSQTFDFTVRAGQ